MADEQDQPQTRTRKTASAKSEQTSQEQSATEARKAEAEQKRAEKQAEAQAAKEKRENERKEREEKRKQEKAERDAKREEEKEAKAKEREEEKKAKEQEKVAARQAQIDAGEIIFAKGIYDDEREPVSAEDVNGDFDGATFTLTSPKKEEVANRALSVIADLQEFATDVPYPGKMLADEYLGGTVQWVAFFGMLRVIGWVTPYRYKTGERGESGLAYKWVGPTKDERDFRAELEGTDEDEPAEAEAVAA